MNMKSTKQYSLREFVLLDEEKGQNMQEFPAGHATFPTGIL